MKISCQSCQAKYTIADEKVLGKVVKIRCKKCSATIVINGNESSAKADDNAETHVFDYTAQGSNEQWTVNVADGDQRSLTLGEIVREYRAGVVTDETYCWKDGMPDWLPLREIEALHRAVGMGPRPSLELDDAAHAPVSQQSPSPIAQDTGAAAALFGSNGGGGGGGDDAGGGGLFGGGAEAAPAAARRAGGRGGGGADLFGGVAQAGGEEDVMTSAAANAQAARAAGAGAAAADDKLTGQRNENSVLFSLSALTNEPGGRSGGGGGGENRTTAQADGSGLIDIRALSANMGANDKPQKSQVDDIMNLSGGGAFGAALAAPILAPPPMEAAPEATSSGGGKGLLFGLIGAGALVALAIVAAVVIVVLKAPSGTTTVATATSVAPIGSLAMNDPSTTSSAAAGSSGGGVTAPTAAATDQAAPPGTGSATSAAAPATGGAAKTAAPATGGAATAKATGAATGATPAVPDPPKTAAAPTSNPGSLQDALKQAAGDKGNTAPPAAPQGGSAPFDRGAAAAALGGVNVASCKKPDGPTGQGHVKVTFGPDGGVQSAVVDGGPFPGTPVGGCIAGKYRGARVPAFSGSPVTVGKSFTIN